MMTNLVSRNAITRFAVAFGAIVALPVCGAAPIAMDGYETSFFSSGIGASAGMRYGPGDALYVTDYGGGRLLRIDSSGTSTVAASGVPFITDVAFTASGRGFVSSSTGSSSTIYELNGATLVPFATGFSFPTSIAAFGEDLYIANSGSGTISRLLSDGSRADLPLGLSGPNGPYGLSFDAAGVLYFVDHLTGRVMSYDFIGAPTQIATASPLGATFTGIGFDGDLFYTDVNLGHLLRVVDVGVTELVASGFMAKASPPAIGPQGIAYDGAGSLFVADGGSIWRLTRTLTVAEPGTLALLCAGFAALIVLNGRRRKEARHGGANGSGGQKRLRGAGGLAPPLFPVAQRPDVDIKQCRKLRLAQPDPCAEFLDGDRVNLKLTGRSALAANDLVHLSHALD
jgi:DNA-binding beta-propeller fold protein YncE